MRKPASSRAPRDTLARFMVGLGVTLLCVGVLAFFLGFIAPERECDKVWIFSAMLGGCGIALILGSRP